MDIESPRPCIPWVNRGIFLMSLIGALINASILHENLDVVSRCENALAGHILLDLGLMTAQWTAKDFGTRACLIPFVGLVSRSLAS